MTGRCCACSSGTAHEGSCIHGQHLYAAHCLHAHEGHQLQPMQVATAACRLVSKVLAMGLNPHGENEHANPSTFASPIIACKYVPAQAFKALRIIASKVAARASPCVHRLSLSAMDLRCALQTPFRWAGTPTRAVLHMQGCFGKAHSFAIGSNKAIYCIQCMCMRLVVSCSVCSLLSTDPVCGLGDTGIRYHAERHGIHSDM